MIDPVAPVSDAQRIRRIATLLVKAVLLAEATRGLTTPESEETLDDQPLSEDESRIVQYLEVAGRASPLAIRTALGLSKTTAYRALSHLEEEGLVNQSGVTRAVVYELERRVKRPSSPDAN